MILFRRFSTFVKAAPAYLCTRRFASTVVGATSRQNTLPSATAKQVGTESSPVHRPGPLAPLLLLVLLLLLLLPPLPRLLHSCYRYQHWNSCLPSPCLLQPTFRSRSSSSHSHSHSQQVKLKLLYVAAAGRPAGGCRQLARASRPIRQGFEPALPPAASRRFDRRRPPTLQTAAMFLVLLLVVLLLFVLLLLLFLLGTLLLVRLQHNTGAAHSRLCLHCKLRTLPQRPLLEATTLQQLPKGLPCSPWRLLHPPSTTKLFSRSWLFCSVLFFVAHSSFFQRCSRSPGRETPAGRRRRVVRSPTLRPSPPPARRGRRQRVAQLRVGVQDPSRTAPQATRPQASKSALQRATAHPLGAAAGVAAREACAATHCVGPQQQQHHHHHRRRCQSPPNPSPASGGPLRDQSCGR